MLDLGRSICVLSQPLNAKTLSSLVDLRHELHSNNSLNSGLPADACVDGRSMHDTATSQSLDGTEAPEKSYVITNTKHTTWVDDMYIKEGGPQVSPAQSSRSCSWIQRTYVFGLSPIFCCLSIAFVLLGISRVMRFFSSLSVGIALVSAVAGLVTPYNNTSTGALSNDLEKWLS